MRYTLPYFLLLFFVCSGVSAQDKVSGQTMTIRNVIVSGNHITRDAIILREIGIRSGDAIISDSIAAITEQNKLRLFNLQLFNEVNQHTERNGNNIDWYIDVKERWYIIPTVTMQFADRNINTWWVEQHHDLHRVTGGLTVTDKNFRGNLEALAVTVQAGYTQRLGLSYMRPYANKSQTKGIGFILNAAQSHQTYYATSFDKLLYAGTYDGPVIFKQLEAGISYLYRPAYSSRHVFQLSYKNYSVRDTILKLNPDFFTNKATTAAFAELFYRYEYNGVDNWNYSLTGYKLVANSVIRQGFSGLKFQAYANIEAGMFRNPLPKWYYNIILRGRLMYLQDQPYFFRGWLGTQTDYVRGYEYYVIDGSQYGVLRLDLKREIFNNIYSIPVKYFTAIPLRIYPKIFFDAGYIRNSLPGNSILSNRILYSAGIGVDIISLYDVKFRFEFAYNHLNQNGLYLHFNSE